MALTTGEQYVESIRRLNPQIYMFGGKIRSPVDHPILRPSLNSVRMTYGLAQDPRYEDLMTATPVITGNKVSRFYHIHHSTQGLINKVKMQRLFGQKIASCFRCCVGMDVFSALYSTTFETDQQYKTNYFESFKKFVAATEEDGWTVDGATTDPKDNHSLAPYAQPGAGMYLCTVERRPDSIIVRGAKVCQTDIISSREVIVMPAIMMGPDGKDYAVSFAISTNAEGIFMIIGRQSCGTRRLEGSEMDADNNEFGGVEVLVVFDDVFVPSDRIFLNDEAELAGMLVERFAGYHRQSYGGYKVGVDDVLIDTVTLAAGYNGVERASAVKSKLIEMVHLNETLFACGIACSSEGKPISSGNYLIDLLPANVCKWNVTRFPYEIVRLAKSTAGGLMVTASSEKDLYDPAVGPHVDKYLCGVNTVSTKNRLRVLRLIENTPFGTAAVGYRTESIHGVGSPQAQCIMVTRQGNISAKKKLAKVIVHIN